MGVVHLDGWGDEDEVNLLALEWRNLAEIVIGIDGSCVIGRHVIGIVHLELVAYHCCVSFVVFCNVEVASHDGRLLAHDVLYLLHDELGAFPASCYANVVEVCVDSHEYLARLLVFKFRIACHTLDGCVPTLRAWNFRRFAQPEVAFLQDFKLVFEEEDWRVLTLRLAICSPHPNIIIFGQTLKQVLELTMQNLLHTNDVDVLFLNVISNSVLANTPAKAGLLVAIVLQTNVESSPTKLCCLLLFGRKTD